MFITSQKEILSIMPTAKWSRPERLYGWIQEEEDVNLIPLLGQPLYEELLADYKRLVTKYGDITAMNIRPDGSIIGDETDGYIAPRTDNLGNEEDEGTDTATDEGDAAESEGSEKVQEDDMARITLIRLCQQIEFYEMLGHKMGLLITSFNEGGVNRVGANNYDPAEKDDVDRASKDAYMSAKRSTDTLLLTLERDARGTRRFTQKWREAEYFYLRKDLLFTTARVMQEYYDLGSSREKYVSLIKDIRFCQNVYLKPRLGASFMSALIAEILPLEEKASSENTEDTTPDTEGTGDDAPSTTDAEEGTANTGMDADVVAEAVDMLRQALALYVEARQNAKTRNVMSTMMADAEQALTTATAYIKEQQEAFGDAIKTSPLYIEPADARATTSGEPATVTRDLDRMDRARGRRQCDGRGSAIFTFPMGGTAEPW
ncbi:MAG: hypothetical protein IJ767_03890 [Bacteroidaceae bacterium]|nr:hypothetical protein [Bacteroidaceae bacterium]